MRQALARPVIGEPAPTIDVVDGSGDAWRLEDQHGHTVVLIFHRHIH